MAGSGEEEAVARARGRGVVAGGWLVHRSRVAGRRGARARSQGVGRAQGEARGDVGARRGGDADEVVVSGDGAASGLGVPRGRAPDPARIEGAGVVREESERWAVASGGAAGAGPGRGACGGGTGSGSSPIQASGEEESGGSWGVWGRWG